ncbi:hypothetical protein CCR95_05610 [Thiocystis minor]|uniref:EAL and HDOD domain-containing protein n=1 Tax=Thiocystis minor TaxID=61597 RepID=UPI001913CF17|nr:HDOD domain-containing protein [Thiocystis minor]MBK5963580.1 hypothetical protein [Thiocystis minor]
MTDLRDSIDTQDFLIARQPIYDHDMGVVGYELRYRHACAERARIEDMDLASLSVILASFLHIGLDTLVGSALAFVRMTRRLVVDESLSPFFEGQVVLELPDDVEPDEQVIAGLTRLKEAGHKLSFGNLADRPNAGTLLAMADYIKLDVLNHDPDWLRRRIDLAHAYGARAVAAKVETQALHEGCKALGFDYFQGFFYCRPKTIEQRSLASNQAVVLRLIQQLEDPDVELRDLERVLAQDVVLTYKLLRYVNSATFARRREIESLREALTLIGLKRIRDWARLILMGQVANGKPRELIVTGMIRARMCERLAERFLPEIQHQMFIVGLLSILDALLDSEMPDLLDHLSLSLPIKLALLDREGPQGELLQQVIEYEQGHWEALDHGGIPTDEYARTYLETLKWCDEVMKVLSDERA